VKQPCANLAALARSSYASYPALRSHSRSPTSTAEANGSADKLLSQAPATFRIYFNSPDGIVPSKVALVAPGSTTHHSDMHQRWVELVVQGTGSDASGLYTDVYPPLRTGNNSVPIGSHAVPGFYMVFLLKDVPSSGPSWLAVPSDAAWVQLQ